MAAIYDIIGTNQDNKNVEIALSPFEMTGIKQENFNNYSLKDLQKIQKEKLSQTNSQRKSLALAYNILCNLKKGKTARYKQLEKDKYLITQKDIFYYDITGNEYYVQRIIKKGPKDYYQQLINDKWDQDLVYIAAEYGHYECLNYLLSQGFQINKKYNTGRTPLEVAAFNNFKDCVKLLFTFGASYSVDHFSLGEAAPQEITIILLSDPINQILEIAMENKISSGMVPLIWQDKTIGKRIARMYEDNGMLISVFERNQILQQYEKCYHAVLYDNLLSILENGLLKPGDSIFASPSLFTTCEACQKNRINGEGKSFCCIVEARVDPDNQTQYPTSILFISEEFLDCAKKNDNWEKIEKLIQDESRDKIGTFQDNKDVKFSLSPFQMTGIKQEDFNNYSLKDLQKIQKEKLSQTSSQERKSLALAYDILYNIKLGKTARYKQLSADKYLIIKKDVFYYAITGNEYYTERIIKQKPAFYQQLKDEEWGQDLLCIASKYGHYECLEYLFSLMNYNEYFGKTPLGLAAFYDFQDCVELLIKLGASKNELIGSSFLTPKIDITILKLSEDRNYIIGTQQDDQNQAISLSPFYLTGIKQENLNQYSQQSIKSLQVKKLPSSNYQERKSLALAYDIIYNIIARKTTRYKKLETDKYLIIKKDVFYYAITGNEYHVERIIKQDPAFYQSQADDEWNRDLLYIASKYGHYKCLQCLLSYGFLQNQQQYSKSTALHGAAFYGFKDCVKLLMTFGASNAIKNQWNSTASSEAATEEIREIIEKLEEDPSSEILRKAIEKKIGSCIVPLFFNDEIIGKRIVRMYKDNRKLISVFERNPILQQYEKCYHETKYDNLLSILENGLLKPGDSIFASPSLFTTCEACQKNRINGVGKSFCCIVEARVDPDSQTQYPTSILFISEEFLDCAKKNDNWEKIEKLIQDESRDKIGTFQDNKDVKFSLSPFQMTGIKQEDFNNYSLKDLQKIQKEKLSQTSSQERKSLALAYDILYNIKLGKTARYKQLQADKYLIIKKDVFYYAITGNEYHVERIIKQKPAFYQQLKDEEWGQDLLCIASKYGHYECLEYLFSLMNYNEYFGKTPLGLAAFYGFQDCVELLIKLGASKNGLIGSSFLTPKIDITISKLSEDRNYIIGTQQDDQNQAISLSPFYLTGIKQENLNQYSQQSIKSLQVKKLPSSNYQERKSLALAYDIIYNIIARKTTRYKKLETDKYLIIKKDVFYYAITGNEYHVERIIKQDPAFYSSQADDEWNRDLLYIASKYGHYKCLQCLLSYGFLQNQQQYSKSTALHGAAFYGFKDCVKLLMTFGASNAIKNQWNSTASSEAATKEIREIIEKLEEDPISEILRKAIEKKIGSCIVPLFFNDKIIGKRIVRMYQDNGKLISVFERNPILQQYEKCYHGTKYDNLLSILEHGFLKPGDRKPDGTKIDVLSGHYACGKEYFGIKNWAAAVFVSPSLFYSCESTYAKRIQSENKNWCCVMEARAKPNSYIEQDSTLGWEKYHYVKDQPTKVEYRIETQDIYATEILFVSDEYLDFVRKYDDWKKIAKLSEDQLIDLILEHNFN